MKGVEFLNVSLKLQKRTKIVAAELKNRSRKNAGNLRD